jgi:hypothetical protein
MIKKIKTRIKERFKLGMFKKIKATKKKQQRKIYEKCRHRKYRMFNTTKIGFVTCTECGISMPKYRHDNIMLDKIDDALEKIDKILRLVENGKKEYGFYSSS